MKMILILFIISLLISSLTTVTLADSRWEVSIREWEQSGFFGYTLYYPYSSQVISKVSLPQDQLMTILKAKYTFDNEKDFVKLQYGWTGAEIKGRGSDSDWTVEGSDILTDYGELDTYGKQKKVLINFGTVLIKNEIHQTNLLLGWVQQETTNELKNVVYHLRDEKDVGDLSQPDNGSYLNGVFRGLLLGINDTYNIRPNLFLAAELNVSFLSTKAYGHWANHSPAWDWENTGKTVGYGGNIGLKYAFNSNIHAELGYYYNYVKSTGCSETLNEVLISQLVDLEYEQQGAYLGLVLLF